MKIKQIFRREMDNINCLKDFYDENGNKIEIDLDKDVSFKYKKLVRFIAQEIESYCEFKPNEENRETVIEFLRNVMTEWIEPTDMTSLKKALNICETIFPNMNNSAVFKTLCVISATQWLSEDEKAFAMIVDEEFSLGLFI